MTATTEQVAEAISAFSKQYDVDDVEQNKSIALDIYQQIDRFSDGIEPTVDEIAQVTVAINEHIQVRDFLMGLPKERHIDYVAQWAAYVGNRTPLEFEVPMATIMASFYYSVEDKAKAKFYLDMALAINPEYSLAKLLTRVYDANWPASSFENMRNELHDSVKAELGL